MVLKTKYNIKAYCYDKRGRLLSRGCNSYEHTHPIQAAYAEKAGIPQKVYLHAEIQAIIKARGAKIHKIKVERLSKSGETRNAKPCPICSLAIKEAGIKILEYTL